MFKKLGWLCVIGLVAGGGCGGFGLADGQGNGIIFGNNGITPIFAVSGGQGHLETPPLLVNGQDISDGGAVTVGPDGLLHFDLSGAAGGLTPPFQVEIRDGNGTVIFVWNGPIFDWTVPGGGGTFIIRLIDSRPVIMEWTIVVVITGNNPAPPAGNVGPLILSLTSPANEGVYHSNGSVTFSGSFVGGSGPFILQIDTYDNRRFVKPLGGSRNFSETFDLDLTTTGPKDNLIQVSSSDGQIVHQIVRFTVPN